MVLGASQGPTVTADNHNLAGDHCQDLPGYAQLQEALTDAQEQDGGGLGLVMWRTIVKRDGTVCAVASPEATWATVARRPGCLGPEGQHGQRL